MKLYLTSLINAINSLEKAILFLSSDNYKKLDDFEKEVVKAGIIQNFEFTYELCWKFIKKWIKNNINPEIVEGISRKELFRIAKENGLIIDIDKWLTYHQARNETSHTYNKNKAEEIVLISKEFLIDSKELLKQLKKRND